jgi:hypothetical protein
MTRIIPSFARLDTLASNLTNKRDRMLSEQDKRSQRIGYSPKDAPWQPGQYLVTPQRPKGKRRLEGKLNLLEKSVRK